MLAINEVLQQGRYRITNCFEHETSGAGYEAYDNVLETNVLLKEIAVDLKKAETDQPTETLKSAFDGEAKILTEIKHESLLHVRDYFSEIDCQYLVSEAVEGSDLGELLEKNKSALRLADVTKWADQLLDALHYLHTRTPPIFHLDIKPQNIKLTADGKIKLLAFGVVENPNVAEASQNLDHAALHYSPLEQIWSGLDRASQNVIANSYDETSEKILNQPADARTDIYRLGATLYHLMTARLPVDALERSIDILEGKTDPLPPPHRINPQIPPEISRVVVKAMEIKRENRFFSAIVMRQVLRTAVTRAKERASEQLKREREEAARKIQLAEQQKIERERQAAEQKRIGAEVRQKRENESIKNRLRESEAKRLQAEKRAAEAEKRLLENNAGKSGEVEAANLDGEEFFESNEKKSASAAVKTGTDLMSATYSSKVKSESNGRTSAPENSLEMFGNLYAQSQDNKIWRRIFVTASALTIFAAAFSGIWTFGTYETSELNQIISGQPVELATDAASEPIIDHVPIPGIEVEPEISQMPTASELPDLAESPGLTQSSSVAVMPIDRPARKNKPALPSLSAPRVERQTMPPPLKPQPKSKKPVTVDDLINDN